MRPLFALAAIIAATAVTPAFAQCCACTETCAPPPPPQVQVWGLSPSYGVVQGPVYTGPGYYTGPVYKTEVSTADYPYVGSTDYFDAGPNADPFRNNLYHPYWPMLPGLSMRASRYHPRDAVSARAMVTPAPHAHRRALDGAVR